MFKYATQYKKWDDLILSNNSLSQCRVYGTAEDSFELIKKNGEYLELGTFKGDYSQKMLDILDPEKLFVLDIFDDLVSSDRVVEFNGMTQLQYVQNRFKDNSNVIIVKENVEFIHDNEMVKGKKFDYVYLDIANEYGTFKNQFYLALNYLKDDGIIGINDYTRNNYALGMTDSVEVFGVIHVINEFLNANNDWHMVGLVIDPSGYNDVMITRK